MNILVWVVFGAVAGWLATKVTGIERDSGVVTTVVVGIIGAFVGGALYQFTTGDDWDFGFNFGSFVVAVVGAVAFLVILRAIKR